MRIYAPNQAILRALGGTNIELILDVPNDSLQSLTNPDAASYWVRTNIINHPDVKFRYIAVGNEVDPNNDNRRYVSFLLPAMKNVQKAIRDAGLANHIKVSTATYTGLLSVSYPPRDGAFGSNVQGFIAPIIKFLVENNSPMLANIYPYFAYAGTPNIDLSYALFTAQGTVVNDNG
ncbi:putative glucan endo-1,3-beta-D-glucosidase [Helianthus annuus]|nr:putative glucan endo-1,3-beta-D-glucosidase [Helianthus annuus]KAJ0784231.1 putative glucan endo-1,3-beta-D-glucosidase [Helianthus annuus]KAJ0793440.1 putative glucan endo-1,3-beta-D-glucosidase [Helianthus annuus]KAJ0958026.1 putative glucan endo-1,3-beta-D-glucosidase [Helianthus annuus]